MIWRLVGVALILALAVTGWRRLRHLRFRRALAALPGGCRDTALVIEDFSDIEQHLRARECPCGGLLASLGERSERRDGVILRVVRVECRRCEELGEVWFDATRAYN